MALLARIVVVALVMASFGCSAIVAAEPSAAVSRPAITSATTPSPDFESLRVKGLNITLPGPQDTIDPDFAGIRSSLAALGIGYIGYSSNSFYNNMLSVERTTFGRQAYNGQKPTFFTSNHMQRETGTRHPLGSRSVFSMVRGGAVPLFDQPIADMPFCSANVC